MNFNELCERILTAQEEMLKHKIEANSVTLNGRKYGKLLEFLPPNVKPTIFGMALKADYALPDDYDFLVQYDPPQIITNADRIRSMTDEQLADILAKGCYEVIECPTTCGLPSGFNGVVKSCRDCWLSWLRKETTNDQIP